MAHPDPIAALKPAATDRKELWLPLLRDLTQRIAPWGVWKNFGSGFRAGGDVDSIAPREVWPQIIRLWVDWAHANNLGPVISCPHVPYLLHLFALHPQEAHMFELDVNSRKLFLGSTLFQPPDVLPLMFVDDLGVRRLRPGAEGLFKLLLNGTRRGSKPNWEAMRKKRVLELLAEDPEGTLRAAHLFGWTEPSILRAAAQAQAGAWDRPAMLKVELRSLSRGILEPWNICNRLWFRRVIRSCPVMLRVFKYGRTVPDDRQQWLAQVRKTHEVID
jgi:hypothetical protein